MPALEENKILLLLQMYTTLLSDTTDTLYESGLPTISSLPSSRPRLIGYVITKACSGKEHFSEGITTSGLTVGNSTTAGFVEFLPTGSQDSYEIRNDTGTLFLSRKTATEEIPFLTLSSGNLTIAPLSMSSDGNDTTELVPILVDQYGRLYRGHSLFQTISQLSQRINALEQAGTIDVESRLSSVEALAQTLRARHNALNLESSKI